VDIRPAGGDERLVSAPLPAGVAPEAIVRALVGAGVPVLGFTVQRSSLEDRFVALTGEGFDVAQ
jgi:ABC-2 type transport system ATP-binding protein